MSVDGVAACSRSTRASTPRTRSRSRSAARKGVVFELTAAKPYDHPACGRSRCVFLWSGLNGTYALLDDDRALVYVLDADGETVTVFVSSGADVFDEFAADADEMLATLSFG